jgi:hypothetical protein
LNKIRDSLKCNKWVEGQEISCHENLAKNFIERGLCSEEKQETKVKTSKKQV